MQKSKRVEGIDVLRILMTFAVLFLHWNNPGGGAGALKYVGSNLNINFITMITMESVCICAVNVFILISGYFSFESSGIKMIKVIELLLETSIISVLAYLAKAIAFGRNFSFTGLALSFLPANYFVIFYLALYIISPVINRIFVNLSKDECKRLIVLLIALFSVWPTVFDIVSSLAGYNIDGISTITRLGSMEGYTIVQFILMYIIGACMGKHKDMRLSYRNALYLLILTIVFTNITGILKFSLMGFNLGTVYAYSNPVVIFQSIAIFTVFENMKLENKKWTGILSEAGFTVYLLHVYVWQLIPAYKIMELPVPIMLGITLSAIFGCYICCVILHYIWKFVFDLFARNVLTGVSGKNFSVFTQK